MGDKQNEKQREQIVPEVKGKGQKERETQLNFTT